MSDYTKLEKFFLNSITTNKDNMTIGTEVETQFVQKDEQPATLKQTQETLKELVDDGWFAIETKGDLVTEVVNDQGIRIFYELGRHNLEVATQPQMNGNIVQHVRSALNELYLCAEKADIYPWYKPILDSAEDVLVVPDERDQTWIGLDGRRALNMLSYISSVQFTFSVSLGNAIKVVNRLNDSRKKFIDDFPQNEVWHNYIRESHANYDTLRYGGPESFNDLNDYCKMLASHDVVEDSSLVPFDMAKAIDIPLFLRSIWWHFRVKKYDGIICIEVRPLSRHADDEIQKQLEMVLDIAFC